MDDNRLFISDDDKVIAGVCAGFADKMNMDPTVVRIGVVLLGLVTGLWIVCVAYYLFTLFLPVRPGGTGVCCGSRKKVKNLFLYSLVVFMVYSPIFGGAFYIIALILGLTVTCFI